MNRNFINKRKKNNLNFKKIIILISLVVLFYLTYIFINNKYFHTISKNYIDIYSNKFGYNFDSININGLIYLDKNQIEDPFMVFKDKSIFLVPLKEISREIMQNKWVKKIQIKSDYKNSINILVEEELPFAIYDNNNQKLLFSENLVILEIIEDTKKYSKLITFYGENSIMNSKKLMSNFDKNFINMIKSATYIEDRRWDIFLKNNIILRLPELKIENSIKNYKKIYANFTDKDLKEIRSIDLRINNQAIIKYKQKND